VPIRHALHLEGVIACQGVETIREPAAGRQLTCIHSFQISGIPRAGALPAAGHGRPQGITRSQRNGPKLVAVVG